jgi:RecB family exonuclease
LQGLQLLSSFFEHFDTSVVPLARERWVSVRLANGVELFGKVDRVDGEIQLDRPGTLDVIDYKTGRAVLDDDEVADEPAAQAYLLATEDEYAREVSRVRFLYLAAGEEARWEPEREDVDDTRDRLLELTDVMYRDKVFEARPGTHCSRCQFAHVCPDAGRVELTDLEVDDELTF